jgi:hypothetical protein
MSEDIKPEPKKSDTLDEATLDQVSGGAMKEEFRCFCISRVRFAYMR